MALLYLVRQAIKDFEKLEGEIEYPEPNKK